MSKKCKHKYVRQTVHGQYVEVCLKCKKLKKKYCQHKWVRQTVHGQYVEVCLKCKKLKEKKKKPYCRHNWVFESHLDFRDGEFYTCSKCHKVKF